MQFFIIVKGTINLKMPTNFFKKFLFLLSFLLFSNSTYANYLLVIGTYRQGPGGRPEVSGITSPSLYALPMKDFDTCNAAGMKITKEIYTPVWQFDSKWTCIKNSSN